MEIKQWLTKCKKQHCNACNYSSHRKTIQTLHISPNTTLLPHWAIFGSMTSSVCDNAERHFLDTFGPLGICYSGFKKLLVDLRDSNFFSWRPQRYTMKSFGITNTEIWFCLSEKPTPFQEVHNFKRSTTVFCNFT